jgi:hypothetical protein
MQMTVFTNVSNRQSVNVILITPWIKIATLLFLSQNRESGAKIGFE